MAEGLGSTGIIAAQEGRKAADGDIAALAKGGRTNFFGFLLRLAARLPFLFIAGRIYGPDALGRFAYAILVVEFAAQIATLGLKRGLALQLSTSERPHTQIVFEALIVAAAASAIAASLLIAMPEAMFPNSGINDLDRLLPLIVMPIALTDVALAALAYRFDIAATVRARSIVEPWAISIAAYAFAFYSLRDGLILSYVVSMVAALATAIVPMLKSYGLPHAWSLRPLTLWRMVRVNLPLAAADGIEWGSRRLDLAILGLFASPATVGIYYVAQQVASLPQKLKTSFEPILGPVIARNVKEKNLGAIAAQVSQVGFWIIAAQLGIALALGMPGEAVMGLVGPSFVAGTGALAFLLAAEVVASPAVVSEAALVYIARVRNLIISLGVIGVQALLSFAFIHALKAVLAARPDWGAAIGSHENYIAACPAAALCLALGLGSLLKAKYLAHRLGHSVHAWRWALLWAAAAGSVTGILFVLLPPHLEWVELAFGVPVILGVYGLVLWRRGFGPEDRQLFKKH